MPKRARDQFGQWLRPVFYLGQNPISLTGAVLTTSAAWTLLAFWVYEIIKGGPIHPYTGIVFFLILPGIFVFGLLLMPVGGLLRRRRLRRQGKLAHPYPPIDLRRPVFRRTLGFITLATFANVAILGVSSYRGVEHMDSVEFCGKTCHTVMAPEFTAYQGSPHSRVACVDCHIGSGAPWFVRAKISGVRQVFAVAFDTYSRPIPSPVKELRPARETCEQCHWPQKFTADKLVVRTKYSDDEKNTPLTTVLLLKIGGQAGRGGTGIHGRHLFQTERIHYVSTDEKRQVIPRVTYVSDEGRTLDYVSSEVKVTPEQLARGERRAMDCMDCHNRPTHAFQLPERAVDNAMAQNRIGPELPFAKKKSVELLRAEYSDRDAAARQIAAGFNEFYRTTYPAVYRDRRAVVESSAGQVADIYRRNIFPHMKIAWGTYPNNIGHEDFLGCFRCHDGSHKSADGKVIPDDCETCHAILAQEETDPKVLADLGLK
jgi:NapC/NirT cytochrome c family, N-terminal region/Cytochrome c7 and related cytochrome c